jgi:hypothetical protein
MTFARQQWEGWLQEPLAWVQTTDRRKIIKDSPTAMVCRQSLPVDDDQPLEIVCKRSIPRNPIKKLYYALRTSRPMQTWLRANALLHRRIPTARPLAVVERRRCGLLTDSMIIIEFAENAHDLDTLLSVHMRELPASRQYDMKLVMLDAIVDILLQLEASRLIHRDFKAPNIMVQWDSAASNPPHVLLVDLDGILKPLIPRPNAPLRAMARLNVSLDRCPRVTHTDRLRFLKRWLGRGSTGHRNWKTVWRELDEMSRQKRRSRTA